MEIDVRRLMLHAALQKIIEGVSIDENVRICCESMSSIYREVDDIRHLERTRQATSWTDSALERVDLKKLGNLAVKTKSRKNNRIIAFTDGDVAIEFLFEKTSLTLEGKLQSTLRRAEASHDKAEHEILAEALVTSVALEALGRRKVSPEELLLGSAPSALDDYRLHSVRRAESLSGALSFLPFQKRKTIYVERNSCLER